MKGNWVSLAVVALPAALLVLLIDVVVASGSGYLTRVTTASHTDRDSWWPSLSADGTIVAFLSDSDFLGQGIPHWQDEVWLYDTGTKTYTRVARASHVYRTCFAPDLSASGTVVALSCDSDFLKQGIPAGQNGIWLYDTATMTYTRVTTASHTNRDSWSPSLSADGTIVAFFSDSDFLDQGIPDAQLEIWMYDTDTKTYTRVTTASDSDRDSWSPSLSADGTIVAFYSDSDFLDQGIPDEQQEIWLYDTATMTYTRVTTASHANGDSWLPSLSADGTVVAFFSDSDFLDPGIPDHHLEVWLYDAATTVYARVTTASDDERGSLLPSLSADGKVIAFVSDSDFLDQGIPVGQYETWLYDTDTMTYTRVTVASHTGRQTYTPNLNADGTVVAFGSDSDFLDQGIPDEQQEIWLYRPFEHQVYLPLVVRNAQ